MRLFFWIVVIVSLVATLLGWTALDPPSLQDVAGAVMGEWYRKQMAWAAIIGALSGGIGGWLATSRVRLKPRESSELFFSRVASFGLWTALIAAILVAAVSAWLAYTYASVPVSPLDRIALLLGAGRFVSVLGLGVFASNFAFALVVRYSNWSGRYALRKP